MKKIKTRNTGVAGLFLMLSFVVMVLPAGAVPVTLEFTGSAFGVFDPSDVFATESGDTYSLLLTYDPDLLPGTDLPGGSTRYETAAGETSISFTMVTSAGDSFTSDNSAPISITIRNTPDFLVTMTPGDGEDSFSLQGDLNETATFNLVLFEALGSNPLSSNDLPTTGFGGGPGTWSVAELDVDRTDLFANISAGVTSIEAVEVPEPSAALLYLMGAVVLLYLRRPKGDTGH